MYFLDKIKYNIVENANTNAAFINESYFTFGQVGESVSGIRNLISTQIDVCEKIIGVVANDDLATYSAIIALWLEGKAFVPLSPEIPMERNMTIIQQAGIKNILDSTGSNLFVEQKSLITKNVSDRNINLSPTRTNEGDLAYILFTSGTTGAPKGVPITRKNLEGFVMAFDDLNLKITPDDRFLQMFELTFDLSVMSYLIPLIEGSCFYTIPKSKIKYAYIYELMEEKELTVALMVPSILHYLQPYFPEIFLPKMRYSLFCGEALPLGITDAWANCLPNAEILNVYGPTEDTIFCTTYTYSRTTNNKSKNGILSIGNSMKGNFHILISENNTAVKENEVGELCLAGVQLTPGYWNNEEKNKEAFFEAEYNGKKEVFYKTGDLCTRDEEGDLLYVGRKDSQVKIHGFRVELSEIEHFAKQFLQNKNAVALAVDFTGNTEIVLVVESGPTDFSNLYTFLKNKLPYYMLPREIKWVEKFALNENGKTDKKKLKSLFI